MIMSQVLEENGKLDGCCPQSSQCREITVQVNGQLQRNGIRIEIGS